MPATQGGTRRPEHDTTPSHHLMPRPPSRLLRCEPLEDRLTPAAAGDLDPTFGEWGRAALPPQLDDQSFGLAAVAVQPDGRIVLAGVSYSDYPEKALGHAASSFG
jgi:hypothetical protein